MYSNDFYFFVEGGDLKERVKVIYDRIKGKDTTINSLKFMVQKEIKSAGCIGKDLNNLEVLLMTLQENNISTKEFFEPNVDWGRLRITKKSLSLRFGK